MTKEESSQQVCSLAVVLRGQSSNYKMGLELT